jgi:serine/threonine-protein kinase
MFKEVSGGSHSESLPASRVIAGRYTLERVLGRGGMGVVWQARHTALNTLVAIKFLNRTTASEDAMRKRFVTEAQVTAQLKTRHAVQVFDFGVTDDGQAFLVMELMEGEALSQKLSREKSLAPAAAVKILDQASRALDRAHVLGIVHRDFKPENVFLARDEEGNEQVKVMDFGVAKLIGDLEVLPDDAAPQSESARPLSTFTRTGAMLGTPYYMAPEQIRNSADVGPQADVWAFAVVAFECLTGKAPFDGKDIRDLFDGILAGRHPTARSLNPALPASFDEWFARGCALDPAKRFGSAHQASVELARALAVPLIPAARISRTDLVGLNDRTPQPTPSDPGALKSDPFARTVAAADSAPDATLAAEAPPAATANASGDGKVDSWTQSIARVRTSRAPVAVVGAVALVALIAAGFAVMRPAPATTATSPVANAPVAVAVTAPPSPTALAMTTPAVTVAAPAPLAPKSEPVPETPRKAPRAPARASLAPAPPPPVASVAAAPPPPQPSAPKPPPSASPFQLPPLGL